MKLRNILAVVGICALAAVSMASRADPLIFELTSDHCSGDGGCIPIDGDSAGTITVTDLGSGSLEFDVALNAGYELIQTGQDATLAFDLQGNPTIVYSGLTANWAVVNGTGGGNLTQAAGALHMDGTGTFEYGVTCKPLACGAGGSDPAGQTLTFTITASGLTLDSVQQNSFLQFFGVDVINTVSGNTGFVDASFGGCTGPDCQPDVPEPQSLALVGLGLFALAMARRKKSA
jgi:PEP-CTERM motif